MNFTFGPIKAEVVQLRAPAGQFNMSVILSDARGNVYYAVEEAYRHSRDILRELPQSALMESVAGEAIAELDTVLSDLPGAVRGMMVDGIPEIRARFAEYQATNFNKSEVEKARDLSGYSG